MKRIVAPDGRAREIRTARFRFPRWQAGVYDRDSAAPRMDDMWIASDLVPLVQFGLELPLALARGVFDRERWIEATCRYPEARITWRVADRRELLTAFGRIRNQLPLGYDRLEFEGVTIVDVTPPDALLSAET